jgi:glycosyltransferase involved in cell wall biosynthesis
MSNNSNKKIKIAFVCHDSGLYGAQKSILTLLLHLNEDVFEPHVIVPSHGPFVEQLQKVKIPFYVVEMPRWIPSPGEISFKYLRKFFKNFFLRLHDLSNLLLKLNVDIVYTNTIVNINGAIAAKLIKKKHVWHLREAIKGNRELSSFLPSFLLPYIIKSLSNRILVNSEWLRNHYFGDDANIQVVYNCADPSDLKLMNSDKISLRQELGIPEHSYLIASIGALHARKGHEIFIRASEKIWSQYNNVFFLIIGSGESEYQKYLQSLAQSLPSQSRILFLGWRDDITSIIAGLDVVVVASQQEPFGRVIIESMAQGKPIVATRSGGPVEIVVDGVTGYLVYPRDDSAIAASVLRLLNDEKLRYSMGQAGYKRVTEKFSIDSYMADIEKTITAVHSGSI